MRPVYYLGVVVLPAAVGFELAHASPTLIFTTASVALVPLAVFVTHAAEEVVENAGPAFGGFLNVTLGNLPKLVIGSLALIDGLHEIAKASIVGWILGNLLLVLGVSILVGGWNRVKQTFSPTAVHAQSAMLLLAVAALILPAIFQLVHGGGLPGIHEERVQFGTDLEKLSFGVAIVLIILYVGGLYFSLRTHRFIFDPFVGYNEDEENKPTLSMGRAVLLLTVAALLMALAGELLISSVHDTAADVGLSEFFIGVIVIAVVSGAGEHFDAVVAAAKDRMDLTVNLAYGSSTQVALFVAPSLVMLSFVLGPDPMPLAFNGYEITGLLLSVFVADFVTRDGESNWFEGMNLLALWSLLGIVFYLA